MKAWTRSGVPTRRGREEEEVLSRCNIRWSFSNDLSSPKVKWGCQVSRLWSSLWSPASSEACLEVQGAAHTLFQRETWASSKSADPQEGAMERHVE